MRRLLAILLLCSSHSLAEPPALRFSIAESWSMPLVRIEAEQPVEGIVFDIIQGIARETRITPHYHVMARLRLQEAMESGDIDVRCYVASQWLTNRPGDYIWSIPLIEQRDLLVGRPGETAKASAEGLQAQAIGTVLGYHYPTLEGLFARGHLQREDSRNQLLVLRKLQAERYQHAVSNQLSLQWFNRQLPAQQRLPAVAVLEEQSLGCMVRSDPALPTQAVLRALVRMKQSGEIERIIQRYTEADGGG
ncbi:ABC transporter substrate-binding protein [Pseudomonas sp. SWRI51]|uniref:substrate-binding periplasmic protein n=1 Tax=Pseudomonas sp. SWRI51 TaxID=2745491 RepID=UPI00320B196A